MNYRNDEIKDSKQLSISQRNKLYDEIRKHAIDYSVIFIDPVQVDELNVKVASINAMKQALEELAIEKPCVALIDAEKIDTKIETKSIIKGDEKSISIASASILAKVCRDRYMNKISEKYPQYHFAKHKGYGTLQHLKALKKYGPIAAFHRFSYSPIKKISESFNKIKNI
jgi:ribonuclease HII